MTTLRGAPLGWALLVVATGWPVIAAADWQLAGGAAPRASVADDAGNQLALYRDRTGQIYLEFQPHDGFSRLARTTCPTFQVDRRMPLHHAPLGAGCRIEDNRAIYTLAVLEQRTLISRAVYDLMNGSRIAFRYVTEDGAYREHVFSLTRSADAIRGALRRDLRIRAE